MVKYLGSAEHKKIIHDSKLLLADIMRIAGRQILSCGDTDMREKLTQSLKEVKEGYDKL
jgi:precorrin isomerase